MAELIDRYLLYRVQVKQDPEAFAKIYDKYVTAIYRFVILKLPRKQDAEDITAETFTRFWQHLQSQKKVKSVRAYLYQIARNQIADFYRSRKNTESLEVVTFEADDTSTSIHEASHGRAYMEARTELALILSQLDKLKDSYRDVLALPPHRWSKLYRYSKYLRQNPRQHPRYLLSWYESLERAKITHDQLSLI
jgi:RNA polymerase sigma factor (sigma-70 family)